MVAYPQLQVILDTAPSNIQAVGSSALAGAVGEASDSGHVHPNTGLFIRQTGTPQAGVTLTGTSQTICQWQVPSDGLVHRFLCFASFVVTVLSIGGAVTVSYTAPDGTAGSATLSGGGLSVGVSATPTPNSVLVKPGSNVTVTQSTGLSLGTVTAWAEIWGT